MSEPLAAPPPPQPNTHHPPVRAAGSGVGGPPGPPQWTLRGRDCSLPEGEGQTLAKGSISGLVLPEEANCAKGQEAGGVRVGELTFPRDLKHRIS